jgi:arginase
MIAVLKVPYDSGHRCERMARGPGYLLSNGVLAGAAVEAVESSFIPEVQCAFDLARQLAENVRAIRDRGNRAVVLSGNCNSAMGTMAGLGCARTGVLWFDAHGEFNTPETTASGFFDGMPLAVLTGRCWRGMANAIPGFSPVPEDHIVLAGVRDTGPEEQAALDASAITQARDGAEIESALDRIAQSVDRWYIHLDLDALDPTEATSNQWVPPGGLHETAVASAIAYALHLRPWGAMAIASLDPACDTDGRALGIARRLLEAAQLL